MPAFIGLPGAREKTEIGRGLFERSEFRSPRRRAKREAGIPDNQRATFLGYFFAAGKKLQNDVILTTARRKNLNRWEKRRFLTLDHRSRLTLFSSFAPRLCPNKRVLHSTRLGIGSEWQKPAAAGRQRENDKRDKPNINESIRIIH